MRLEPLDALATDLGQEPGLDDPDPAIGEQLAAMIVFDLVIDNADRKGGHVLLEEGVEVQGAAHGAGDRPPRRVRLVDHGVSFHTERKLRTVAWERVGDPVPEPLRADVAALSSRFADEHAPALGPHRRSAGTAALLLIGAGEAAMGWQAEQVGPTLPAFVRVLLRVLRENPQQAQTKLRASDDPAVRVQGRCSEAGCLRGFLDHDPNAELAHVAADGLALTGAPTCRSAPTTLTACVRSLVHAHRAPPLRAGQPGAAAHTRTGSVARRSAAGR